MEYLLSTIYTLIGAGFLVGLWFIGSDPKNPSTPAPEFPLIRDSDGELTLNPIEALGAAPGIGRFDDDELGPAPSDSAIQRANNVIDSLRNNNSGPL